MDQGWCVSAIAFRVRDGQSDDVDLLRGGGFVGALVMDVVVLAPSGSRWTDSELCQFDTKSGARGDFVWSA